MAKVDFPANPTDGQQLSVNGLTYTFNSAKGTWRDAFTTVNINSNTPPANPEPGQLWFNTGTAVLYIYYNDGSSSQWVSVSGPKGDDGASASLASASSSIIPDTDSAYDLGSTTRKWKDLYLSGSTLNLGGIKLKDAGGSLKVETDTGTDVSPGGGATSYANLAAFPSSGNTAGDLGFATDTKAVYVWDGTEWDRVYTDANAIPEWTTEPPATANLAIDGTATNQTVIASDPEGFPIEYSYDTNPSNQSQATISQSNNAFTITPSTADSDAGSFTLRYKATDGLHSTSKSTIYTLEFSTPMNVSTAGSGSRMTINANSTTGALSLSAIVGSSETSGVAYVPTTGLKLGKQYIELNTTSSLATDGDRFFFGIGDLAMAQAGTLGWNTLNDVQISMYAETPRYYPFSVYGVTPTWTALDDGNLHTIMIAYDTTAERVWFGVDGTWDTSTNTGGAPGTGAGMDISGINFTTGHAFVFGSTAASENATLQFVSGPGQTLTYAVPTGFNAY